MTTTDNDDARSRHWRTRAAKVLVGGVNSPVRSFGAVGGAAPIIRAARGAELEDVDGRRYVDLMGSWGTAIVGHAHAHVVAAVTQAAADGLSFGASCPAETHLAEMIVEAIPSVEMIRFVNSGTEATMSAVRLARAATGRDAIIKFAGGYHGHADALLVQAGSGAITTGTPDSSGVPASAVRDTLQCVYNDTGGVGQVMAQRGRDIAAIIVEPVAGNMGMVPPIDGFLETLRMLCDEHGSLLIFDEVMTGFRVAWGGYQVARSIRPDITCLGKVIGGGMPVAAYGGSTELLSLVSPLGPMYQAGTLSGNPLGMAAGAATLEACREVDFYVRLDAAAQRLAGALATLGERHGRAVQTSAMGGMVGLAFADQPLRNFDDARGADHEAFRRFFHGMLEQGIWLPPSPYETLFLSAAHDAATIDRIVEAAGTVMEQMAS